MSQPKLEILEAATFVDVGVFFVKTLRDLASKPDAADDVKLDWALIQRWLGASSDELSEVDIQRFRTGWKAYIAIGLAPSKTLQPTFDIVSSALLASEPNCKQHKPPTAVMDAFDRLLATKSEIKQKREQDIASEKARLTEAISNFKSISTNEKLLHKKKWRERTPEFRKWVFASSTWFAAVILYALVFDPYDEAWYYWSEAEVLKVLVIAMLPTFAWGLKAIYDRYVA